MRRYQDSKDRGATSNLKSHAIKCFGKDVVAAAFNDAPTGKQDGSIFAEFTRQGQAPVKVTHQAHTTEETRRVASLSSGFFLTSNDHRAHIVRWCTESNRPLNIVKDREFEVLMKAGRPGTMLPSASTVTRDVKAAFERCREHIDSLLKVSAKCRVHICY